MVVNLTPRKMRFNVSEGMVLTAAGPWYQRYFSISPNVGSKPGMQVKIINIKNIK